MNKDNGSFDMERAGKMKTRAHKALFDNDLPFRAKVVQLKNRYKRSPKHKGKNNDY